MKRLVAMICVIISMASAFTLFGCSNSDKVTVTFDGVQKVVSLKTGECLSESDLPAIASTNENYEFTWAIDISKPITEDIVVEKEKYTSGLKLNVYKGDQYIITGWEGSAGTKVSAELFLPTYYNGRLVTAIEQQAFGSIGGDDAVPCSDVNKVHLPKYLVSIGAHAFAYLRKLRNIEFPDTLEIVGAYAFNACSLNKLELPKSLLTIGDRAFAGSNNTYNFANIPEGVEVLSCFAVVSKSMQQLILPKSLKEIQDGGLWPPAQNKLTIYYSSDRFDWEYLCENISDLDVADMNGDGEAEISSLDVAKQSMESGLVYLYSENAPEFDASWESNTYWHYDQYGKPQIWENPVE